MFLGHTREVSRKKIIPKAWTVNIVVALDR